MAHIFISHSGKDDAVVAEIRRALEGLVLEVWADSQRLSGGVKLEAAVRKAIEDASHFIAVLSPNAVNSRWVLRELQYALKVQRKRGEGYKVIPVLLKGVEPEALRLWFKKEPLAVIVREDPGGVAAALPDLLAALGVQLPSERPPEEEGETAPIADLVLELSDPGIEQWEGKRRAAAEATLTYCPPDGSRKVESKRYRLTAPLGPIEVDELAWYLERYHRWPSGVFHDRARRVEEQLPRWGRLLYEALAGEPARNALESWKAADAHVERRFTVLVDQDLVTGSPDQKQNEAAEAAALLLALPWELLHDERGFLFRGARGVRVRRRLPNRYPQQALATKPPIRVLLVSPRPEDDKCAYIDHRVSARPLVEALLRLGALAQFKLLTPPTHKALEEELQRAWKARTPYHVVHFDGHGIYSRKLGLGALCFEDPQDSDKLEKRGSALVNAADLAQALRDHRVPLVFLEACQTAMSDQDPTASVAGALLQSGVASVAAMSHSVLVETARRFVTAFYQELMSGARIGQAMLAGQRELKGDDFRGKRFAGELRLQDWFVPVLFQEEQDPQVIKALPPEQVRAVMEEQRRLALGHLPPEPSHSFIGRSRELLAAERLLERAPYVVLLGEAGEGKTTLAAELARWLVATRRFERAAFVALDRHGEARGVLFAIGEQLVPNYVSRAAQDARLALQLVQQALTERSTVLVLDNMESVLEPPPGSQAAAGYDPDVLKAILDLCTELGRVKGTRLVFTSREAMPQPFDRHHLRIGRLDRPDAILLVGRVLGEGNLMPHAQDAGASEEEIEKLVDAVGCHARSLVLLAAEVARAGVRSATEQVSELMARLHERYPDDRERSLFASVELSLRRLPASIREKVHPLGVLQGGGSLPAIGVVLGLDPEKNEHTALAEQLVGVGLAEQLRHGYLRLDPALGPALLREMSAEEQNAARAAWVEAMAGLVAWLYEEQYKHPELALNLALLELPNLLAALEWFTSRAPAEEVVGFAGRLEGLMHQLGRPKALARVAEIRAAAAAQLGAWSRARFQAEATAVERFLDGGRYPEAVAAARALLEKAQAAGEKAYEGAAYERALAHFMLGRTLKRSGAASEALAHIEAAQQRFEALAASGDRDPARMACVTLAEKADCLRALGRLDEAAAAYEGSIRRAAALDDPRQVAVGKGQLATVRMLQVRYQEALAGYHEARKIFEKLGEPSSVATAWHQIGMVHREARQYEQAEEAYQESLKIWVQTGNRSGEAGTLNELGNLYDGMGRDEDAVRLHSQQAAIARELEDLAMEGRARNNAAASLITLRRYDEARLELERAVACFEPFGHAAEPWKAFALLSDLERAVGNERAALAARQKAIKAYLAYRRDGGESQTPGGRLCAAVAQAIASGQAGAVSSPLSELLSSPDLPAYLKSLIPALQAILAGNRDSALADDPNLYYRDAAELRLLLESL